MLETAYLYRSIQLYHLVIGLLMFDFSLWYAVYWNKCCCWWWWWDNTLCLNWSDIESTYKSTYITLPEANGDNCPHPDRVSWDSRRPWSEDFYFYTVWGADDVPRSHCRNLATMQSQLQEYFCRTARTQVWMMTNPVNVHNLVDSDKLHQPPKFL